MSRDQRPGKVKLVGSPALAPAREAEIAATPASSADPTADVIEPKASTNIVLPSLLFLLGCAGGGAAFAALPYFRSLLP